MLNDIGGLNWIGILLATGAYFILGGLWFSPFGFERAWDRALGFTRPPGLKWGPEYYAVPLAGCLVITIATAILIQATGVQSMAEAVRLGLVVGIGYAAAATGVMALSPVTPHPALLGAVVGGYHVVGIVIAAVILVAMG